jgi:hypothetical protein
MERRKCVHFSVIRFLSRKCVHFSVIRFLIFLQRIWKHLGATCEEFPYLSWTPLVDIKFMWAFTFFYSRAKGGNEVGKGSLVTRFEVFIEAKIHPMHIRHYDMEAYGGGVWRNSYTQIQHRPEEGVCGHHV